MDSFLLVKVDDFDVPGTAILPYEADAPLIVDADTVLPTAVAQFTHLVDLAQLALVSALDHM